MSIDERTKAREEELRAKLEGQRRLACPADYVYDKAQEQFWDLKDGTIHTEKAVDASIPIELWRVEVEEGDEIVEGEKRKPGRPKKRKEKLIPPSKDIQRVENDQFVEGTTWWPGKPQIIKDFFINSDGFYPSPGRRILNLFRPVPVSESTMDAGPWIDHVKKLWPEPDEHEYFFDYCAHMVQRPDIKCNAAIVLSGAQRIGKDAALIAVKMAVGSWNTKGIDPDELMSNFRPWLQTLMLTIDEVRPTKDEFHASSMYNILKPMIAAPPDTLPMNDKNVKLRHIVNVLRVFITTNDWMAMYIPPEDQRMFIMHSTMKSLWHIEEDPEYFNRLFGWFEDGGFEAVGAWLRARDLSKFNPKGEVRKTRGWKSVANTWGEPEDAVSNSLDALGNPDIVFASELLHPTFDGKEEVAGMIKSPRKMGFRMQKSGYVAIEPDNGADRWAFAHNGRMFRSRVVYVKEAITKDASMYSMIRERGAKVAARLATEPQLTVVGEKM